MVVSLWSARAQVSRATRRTGFSFLHFSHFPSLFQGARTFGLNFLDYCAGGNVSSHVGISQHLTLVSMVLTDIYIERIHRNKMLFEMEKSPMPFNS